MKDETLESTTSEDRIIFSIDVATIQMFAEEHLNRKLSVAELDFVEHRFDDYLGVEHVYESACSCFDEILDRK